MTLRLNEDVYFSFPQRFLEFSDEVPLLQVLYGIWLKEGENHKDNVISVSVISVSHGWLITSLCMKRKCLHNLKTLAHVIDHRSKYRLIPLRLSPSLFYSRYFHIVTLTPLTFFGHIFGNRNVLAVLLAVPFSEATETTLFSYLQCVQLQGAAGFSSPPSFWAVVAHSSNKASAVVVTEDVIPALHASCPSSNLNECIWGFTGVLKRLLSLVYLCRIGFNCIPMNQVGKRGDAFALFLSWIHSSTITNNGGDDKTTQETMSVLRDEMLKNQTALQIITGYLATTSGARERCGVALSQKKRKVSLWTDVLAGRVSESTLN